MKLQEKKIHDICTANNETRANNPVLAGKLDDEKNNGSLTVFYEPLITLIKRKCVQKPKMI